MTIPDAKNFNAVALGGCQSRYRTLPNPRGRTSQNRHSHNTDIAFVVIFGFSTRVILERAVAFIVLSSKGSKCDFRNPPSVSGAISPMAGDFSDLL